MVTRKVKSGPHIRGCGKLKPGFLYRQKPLYFLEITTLDTDHCGGTFIAPQEGPREIFLCRDCLVRHGLLW